MKTFLALLLSAVSAFAADHIITWSQNPASEQVTLYNVWLQVGTVWTQLGQTPGTTFTRSNVSAGTHTYALSAINSLGEGPKSISIVAIVPALPSAPTNIIVNLRASIQSSETPGGPWKDFVMLSVPADTMIGQAYFRARMDVTKIP